MNKLLTIIFLACTFVAKAQNIVLARKETTAFPLVSTNETATILIDDNDDLLVHISAQAFAGEVEKISGEKPVVSSALLPAKALVIIGSLDKSTFIQQLIKKKTEPFCPAK